MEPVKIQYAVTGNGLDKNGNPYSKANKIVHTKDAKFAYLSNKDVIYLNEVKPLLSVISAETRFA